MWQICGGCWRERPVRGPWVRVLVIILLKFLSPAPRSVPAQGHANCGSVAPGAEESREWDAEAGPLASAKVCVSVALTRNRGAQAFDSLHSLKGPQWRLSHGAAAMQPLPQRAADREACQLILLPWL